MKKSQKKIYNHVALCLSLSTLVLLSSCAGPTKIQTAKVSEFMFEPSDLSNQNKASVTINVKIIKPSEDKQHPELFNFNRDNIDKYFFNSLLYYPEMNGVSRCYTFGINEPYFLTAFKVKITNNTSHILRMKDSRIYLVAEGENPIPATTKLGDPHLDKIIVNGEEHLLPKSAINKDESLVHWVTSFENEYETNRKKGLIDFPYVPGFASQVILQNISSYTLINDLSVEILPEMSYEGILLFPKLVSADLKTPRLMFYDIITKTDAAGNVAEKTTFEFPLKYTQTDMWYDATYKDWKVGLPPAVPSANAK